MTTPARCEWCNGIVSTSMDRGDESNPIRAEAHSAGAVWFHTTCAVKYEERYVTPRFYRFEHPPQKRRVF